jgi:hypothetical protein
MPPDFVYLTSRFTSSWPWPESSWGLDPMYGEDGWCRSCGVPQRPQTGSLVLQASKMPKSDFWMPNWQYDALCVRKPAAEQLLRDFRVKTLPVHTPKATDTGILQLVPDIAAASCFDSAALAAQAEAFHGLAGRRCESCRTWRWMPLVDDRLPHALVGPEADRADLVAGPDWFGDGCKAFRALLFRRPLAEALVRLNPRVWSVVESRRERR